ncbi:MAG: TolC family protein [Gammaproteobacteria bacterium]|nr:TolC family protein [Gammaproteobacteria bacterium]
MKRFLINIPATVLLAVMFTQAQAETIVLDLPQSVERAMNTDPRITEKEKLVEAARALLNEAEGAEGWMVGINSFVGLAPTLRGGFFETTGSGGEQGVGIPDDAFDMDGISPWYYMDFSLIKPLHTFGKVEGYKEAAAGNIQIKKGDVALRRGETTLEVTRAYNGFLASRDTRLMLEDTLRKFEAAVGLVEGWLEEGEGAAKQSDLFALQTGVALLARYVAEAKGFENIALAGLRLLTGIAPEDTLNLADKRLSPVALPEGELKELQSKALVQRPEIHQLTAGLKARRGLVKAKKSEDNPNLYTGVVGVISYAPAREDVSGIGAYDPFNSAGATPVLGLQWDWSVGRQPAKVAQAQAELEATLAVKAFAQQGIPFQVEEQYHTVHAHHEMVQKLYEGSRSGRRWMISSYADFEAGLEEADKVISAFLGYIQAYSDYLKTVNDYNLHVTRLKVITGEIQ